MRWYWTCSKFADRLRGSAKIKSGTSEEWEDWREQAQAAHPIRWWIAEKGLDYLETFILAVPNALYNVKYYINNRWVTHTHALVAHPRDIERGKWQDVGNRFLPCLFNELVDFVEIELAWWHIAWADPTEKKKYDAPFWATGWFRWRSWRCPQAGLDNLKWQSDLVYDGDWLQKDDPKMGQPTPQAENAREILALYKWWTEVYHNRPDPMDASGWSAYCDDCHKELGEGVMAMLKETKSPELKARGEQAHKLLHEIEELYEKEDEDMMVRLIKARNALWT